MHSNWPLERALSHSRKSTRSRATAHCGRRNAWLPLRASALVTASLVSVGPAHQPPLQQQNRGQSFAKELQVGCLQAISGAPASSPATPAYLYSQHDAAAHTTTDTRSDLAGYIAVVAWPSVARRDSRPAPHCLVHSAAQSQNQVNYAANLAA